jgi:hypothetical protein
MKSDKLSLIVVLFVLSCSDKTEPNLRTGVPQFQIEVGDVSNVTMTVNVPNKYGDNMDVALSGAKAAEFQKFTQKHLNQMVQILAGSNVVLQPTYARVVSSGVIKIPILSAEVAEAIDEVSPKK